MNFKNIAKVFIKYPTLNKIILQIIYKNERKLFKGEKI